MIRFDFIVSDQDAENIFDCINQCINRNNEVLFDLISARKDQSVIEIYQRDNEYLKELKTKMLNYRKR